MCLTLFIISLLYHCLQWQRRIFKTGWYKLYVTGSTFHYMDGNDTATKLLNERTGKLAE